MTLGFTGPSHGMTERQAVTVLRLFKDLPLTKLHHGLCVGADATAHLLAREAAAYVVGHPPTDEKLTAKWLICDERRPQFSYLVRNRHVVAEGIHGLIATPKSRNEPNNFRGNGTWTTIGYARQANRRIWLVWPDGTFTEEGNE